MPRYVDNTHQLAERILNGEYKVPDQWMKLLLENERTLQSAASKAALRVWKNRKNFMERVGGKNQA